MGRGDRCRVGLCGGVRGGGIIRLLCQTQLVKVMVQLEHTIGELKIGAGGEDIECARTVSAVDGFIAVRLMLMLGDVKVG